MAAIRIFDVLPEIYKNFLPKFFESTIAEETAATCRDCAMWKRSEADQPDEFYYLRETKCCTYYPNLPNYLVGALLSDTDLSSESGRTRIRKTIKSRIGVIPHGLRCPEKFALLIHKSPDAFGRSRSFLCPYYDPKEGKCAIWPFRDASCSTWFCKFTAGEDGKAFWFSLKSYLKAVENTLIRYSLFKMGWMPEKIIFEEPSDRQLEVQDVDDQPLDQKSYKDLWGDWVNREEEFYKETFHLVHSLTPGALEKIGGISLRILLEEVKMRQKNLLKPKLPGRLKRNPKLEVEKMEDGFYRLVGYSPRDPLEVSKRVYDLLDFFNGRKMNKEVFRLIKKQMKAEPTEDLLTTLHQFRILVSPENE
jgi:Fe-S-cluster containining protein